MCGSKARNKMQQKPQERRLLLQLWFRNYRNPLSSRDVCCKKSPICGQYEKCYRTIFHFNTTFQIFVLEQDVIIGFSNKWLCILLYSFIEVNIINFLQCLAHKIKECLTWQLWVFLIGCSFIHYNVTKKYLSIAINLLMITSQKMKAIIYPHKIRK